MITDIMGNEISIGDYVVFVSPGLSDPIVSLVKYISDHMIKTEYCGVPHQYILTSKLVKSDKLLKLDSRLLIMLKLSGELD